MKHKITVQPHGEGYKASIFTGIWAYGKNTVEAVGNLILAHADDLEIGLEYLLNAYQWAKAEGIQIVDPDGWRTDGLSLYEPITQAEWEKRRDESTIYPLK